MFHIYLKLVQFDFWLGQENMVLESVKIQSFRLVNFETTHNEIFKAI